MGSLWKGLGCDEMWGLCQSLGARGDVGSPGGVGGMMGYGVSMRIGGCDGMWGHYEDLGA